jgi:hypothetical protein
VSIYITNAAGNDTIWIGFHLRFFLSFFLSRPERKIIKSERIIIKENNKRRRGGGGGNRI